jgi:hypothetical protein
MLPPWLHLIDRYLRDTTLTNGTPQPEFEYKWGAFTKSRRSSLLEKEGLEKEEVDAWDINMFRKKTDEGYTTTPVPHIVPELLWRFELPVEIVTPVQHACYGEKRRADL